MGAVFASSMKSRQRVSLRILNLHPQIFPFVQPTFLFPSHGTPSQHLIQIIFLFSFLILTKTSIRVAPSKLSSTFKKPTGTPSQMKLKIFFPIFPSLLLLQSTNTLSVKFSSQPPNTPSQLASAKITFLTFPLMCPH